MLGFGAISMLFGAGIDTITANQTLFEVGLGFNRGFGLNLGFRFSLPQRKTLGK